MGAKVLQVPELMANGSRRRPETMREAAEAVGLRVARLLSAILVVLLAAASAAGLWIDGLYQDPDSVAAMFRGYDLVTLVVVAPLLAVTLLPSLRRSPRARLLWVGMLAFSVYNYALYVFGTAFNDVFLLHVAVFSLSIFALILALANLDVPWVGRHFGARTPVRWISVVLGFLAVALGGMWIFFSLRFAVTGEVPQEPSKLVLPTASTHLGWVLDLALLVPVYLLAAVLLWRRAAWGYVLATVSLVAGTVHQLSYMTALVFQARAEVPGATAFDPQEPFIAAAILVAAVLLLANVRRTAAEEAIRTS